MINTRVLDGEGAFGEIDEEGGEVEEEVEEEVEVAVVEGEEEELTSAVPNLVAENVIRREEIGTACGTAFSAEEIGTACVVSMFDGIPLFVGSEVSSLLVG